MSTSVDWVYLRCQNREEFLISKSKLFSKSNFMYSIIDQSDANNHFINMDDVCASDALQLVQFIERDDLILHSVENAIGIYFISKRYEIQDLQKLCRKFLIDNVSFENVCIVHNFACQERERLIQYYCWRIFDGRWKEIFESESLANCTSETILTLLSRPKYETLSEAILFSAVFVWSLTNFSKQVEISPTEVMTNDDLRQCFRQVMIPYFPMIRFYTMTENDLENHVIPLNLLTDEEIRAIRSHFLPRDEDPRSEVNIPETICTSTANRLEVDGLTLFHYQCRRNLDYEKDLLFSSENIFMCEIKVDYDCFLTSIKLPIKHQNKKKGITVQVEGYTVSEQNSLNFEILYCDRYGHISIPEPIFLEKDSTSRIWVKIPEHEINPRNYITVESDRDDFISDEEFRKYYAMKPKSKKKKWNKQYCNVVLYF